LGTLVALQLCRLLRDSTAHWLTPSRALEQDLPAADRDRYAATTAAAREEDLRTAARNSWRWSRDLAAEAADRWGIHVPHELHEQISGLLDEPR
jgi:lincosamide nucleotidyltransferase